MPWDDRPQATDREMPKQESPSSSEKSKRNIRTTNAPELRLAVVKYDDSPDRGTIHPPDLTGLKRMETWISVDMSVVVDLSAWR